MTARVDSRLRMLVTRTLRPDCTILVFDPADDRKSQYTTNDRCSLRSLLGGTLATEELREKKSDQPLRTNGGGPRHPMDAQPEILSASFQGTHRLRRLSSKSGRSRCYRCPI